MKSAPKAGPEKKVVMPADIDADPTAQAIAEELKSLTKGTGTQEKKIAGIDR